MLLLRLEDRMVSVAMQSAGLCASSMAIPTAFIVEIWSQPLQQCSLGSHKDWPLGRSYFSYTWPICCGWSSPMGRVYICMLIKHRSTASATRVILLSAKTWCLCIDEVALWMWSNRLHINADKSKVLCFISMLATSDPWRATLGALRYCDKEFGLCEISASVLTPTYRCQLVWFVQSPLRFVVMRQIRSIRQSVSQPILCSLVVLLVLTRVDYSTALLAGLPRHLLAKKQSVLNAAAYLVSSATARKHDHMTPLLCELHWLKASERIIFQLAVMVYRCHCGLEPSYLAAKLIWPSETTAISFASGTDRPNDITQLHWWPLLSCCRCAHLVVFRHL